MATRASWSAVAAPAETPSSVALVRVVAGTCGFRPSTTATTTASVTSRGTSVPVPESETMSSRRPGRSDDVGDACDPDAAGDPGDPGAAGDPGDPDAADAADDVGGVAQAARSAAVTFVSC